jgi:hypothetical protein
MDTHRLSVYWPAAYVGIGDLVGGRFEEVAWTASTDDLKSGCPQFLDK